MSHFYYMEVGQVVHKIAIGTSVILSIVVATVRLIRGVLSAEENLERAISVPLLGTGVASNFAVWGMFLLAQRFLQGLDLWLLSDRQPTHLS